MVEIDRMEIIDDVMIDILKQKSPFERLLIAFGLWRSAKYQLFNYIRSFHPDWDEERIYEEVARRISHGATSSRLIKFSKRTGNDIR